MKDFDIEKIITKNDFELFLEDFFNDFILNKDRFENNNLESFLIGLKAFVNSIDNYYINVKNKKFVLDSVSWKVFAEILLAARVYE